MSSLKDELELLEYRMKQIPKEIKQAESEKKSIEKELEKAELEAELKNNEVAYYAILIKELLQEYGDEGIEMLKEIAPDILEELGSETSHD